MTVLFEIAHSMSVKILIPIHPSLKRLVIGGFNIEMTNSYLEGFVCH